MKKSIKICLSFSFMFISFGLLSQEIYQSNAASVSNESNSTTGWVAGATITSDATESQSGSFSIKAVSTSNDGRTLDYAFNATIGQAYTIRIWAKAGPQVSSPASPAFAAWNGFSGFSTTPINSTQWTEYVFNVTATQVNPMIRVYTSSYSTRFTAGNTIFIDSISILSAGGDTQNPTAPTSLSSTSQTQNSISLGWSAATDNVGVTGYKVFRNSSLIATLGSVTSYTATGLTASTQYSFYVTALDAANNESAASNSISATTDSSSGGGSGGLWTESGSDVYYNSGNVGIGTANPGTWKLAVNGFIRAKEIKVETGWADYVFKENYNLPTLEEVEKHIKEKGHLKDIPSAKEVAENGILLGDMDSKLLQKIEELTLYTIRQENKIKKMAEDKSLLEGRLSKLENRLKEK